MCVGREKEHGHICIACANDSHKQAARGPSIAATNAMTAPDPDPTSKHVDGLKETDK